MKRFCNPWYDARNGLSPREFEVSDEPIESFDVIDFYEVKSPGQMPSVLAVLNHERTLDINNGKGAYDRAVGQYVTVEGAKRAIFPKEELTSLDPEV